MTISGYIVFSCIVWYVIATRSWIYIYPKYAKMGLQIVIWDPMWFWRIHFTWRDLVLAFVQLPWMLMANRNLLQKHARNLIYAINLNETGYLRLFFLTEKIYEKNCFRNNIFGKFNIQKKFPWKKTQKEPQNWDSLHTSILKWFCLVFVHLPSVTIELLVLEVRH